MNEPTTFSTGEIKNAKEKDTVTESLEEKFSEYRKARFLLEDETVKANDKNSSWFFSFPQSGIETIDTYQLPFIPLFNTSAGNFDNWTLSLNATNNAINQT